MLTSQYDRPAQKVQASKVERLVLHDELKDILNGVIFLFSQSGMFLKLC